MRNLSTTGGAVPVGWTTAIAQLSAFLTGDFDKRTDVNRFVGRGPFNLLDGIAGLDQWLPRDQEKRGTCTAFAVAAAEEIWEARRDGSPIRYLSVEYAYAAMRAHSFADAGITGLEDEPEKEAELLATGATYLSQANLALEETGICEESLVPYRPERGVAFVETDISATAHQDAAMQQEKHAPFVHAIARVRKGPAVGLHQVWDPPLTKRVSSIFVDALEAGAPVVAAFAILNRGGDNTWQGTAPRLCGVVDYPDDVEVDKSAPVAGHSVCITGFVPPKTDHESDRGLFIFRNSFGIHDFALDAGRWRCGAWPTEPGYGIISPADVDRFCWEYMYRKPE